MQKAMDTLNASEKEANAINAQNKQNMLHRHFELMLSLSQDLQYQMSELAKIGLSPMNSAEYFALVAQHQYLMTEALKPMTKLYEAVLGGMNEPGR